MNRPVLGSTVREIISGYEGVVVGLVEYLWGCDQALVSRADKDYKPESEWFDINRLVQVDKPFVRPTSWTTTGADKPAPVK